MPADKKPAQDDDVRRKFREALDRKNKKANAHIDDSEGVHDDSAVRPDVAPPKQFMRRKSGGGS
jgi:Family of unknown function (DUF5302)